MRLRRLELFDYRNFAHVDVEFQRSRSIIVGDNAQGKSNLLEAGYLLATMRALRAEADVHLIRHGCLDDVAPAARVVGDIETLAGPLKLEVIIAGRAGTNGLVAGKTVRVNGVPKRLSDAVGRLTSVIFSADDLEKITGPRAIRRRDVDLMLMQVDRAYSQARSRYERVLNQRNHLLKRIREADARADELEFWDSELIKDGALLFQRRGSALAQLAGFAADRHADLAGERLEVAYQPRLEPLDADVSAMSLEDVSGVFAEALRQGQSRDIAAGMTLQGPHRDDVIFTLNDLPASSYASRAQQRTIALSLRLAEAQLLSLSTGEAPVLLLDDVLSEMDSSRRRSVLAAMSRVDQMIVTGTDWDRFPPDFVTDADLLVVEGGTLRSISSTAAHQTPHS